MSLAAHTIQSARGSRKKSKRVGRGNATGKGTTAARGTKGQRARSGGTHGIARRSFREQVQKMKKVRGFTSMYDPTQSISLSVLERVGSESETVTPYWLEQKGVVAHAARGVKIVATGELKKKLTIKGCLASKAAAEAIEKAGGTITF